jgi:hypothetical protein
MARLSNFLNPSKLCSASRAMTGTPFFSHSRQVRMLVADGESLPKIIIYPHVISDKSKRIGSILHNP